MKKTIVKILVAVMAATMVIGAAAGCGSTSGSGSSDVSTESKTESSVLIDVDDSQQSSKTETLLGKTDTDKIESLWIGKDPTGQYEGYFFMVNDGSKNGSVSLFIANDFGDGVRNGGYVEGVVEEMTETKNEDGTTTKTMKITDKNQGEIHITAVYNAEGNSIEMSFEEEKNTLTLSKVDDRNTIGKKVEYVLTLVNTVGSISNDMSDAATLDCAFKDYYAGVVSGVIYEGSGVVTCDKLPAKDASAAERKELALKLTLKGALQYSGIESLSDKLSSMSAASDGNVFAQSEGRGDAAVVSLSENMTMAELGYK